MKIIVDTKNYTPFTYSPYLKRGNEIKKPADATLEVGQVVVVKDNGKFHLAVILGCIDEKFDGVVKLDLCGVTDIENIRPTNIQDFEDKSIERLERLDKECRGFKVTYNWNTYEAIVEEPNF